MGFDSSTAAEHPAMQEAIEWLRAFVAVPSISAHGRALTQGAQFVATRLRQIGLDVDIWASAGAPVVYASALAPAGAPTLLLYGHYDVQPPDPLDAWDSPPFEAQLRDGAIFGRGAGDNKGQLVAHIAALAHLLRQRRLPIGVKFLIEGEEEIGSPHLAQVVRDHRAELDADLAVTSDGPMQADHAPSMVFGVRGLLYLELEACGAVRDLHSGNRGGLAPLPAWHLVQAIASLRSARGRVQVEGFYDPVRPPTPQERRLLRQLPFDRERLAGDLGAAAIAEMEPTEAWHRLMFEPTLNIPGFSAGYTGPGVKTIIPHRASCKLEFRLVADQQPDRIAEAVRRHLHETDPTIRMRVIASVPPSYTAIDAPYSAAVRAAVTDAAGRAPVLQPRLAGTTPDYVFTQLLGVPSFLVPYGPPDMHHHAPNERMTLRALAFGIRCTERLCRCLG